MIFSFLINRNGSDDEQAIDETRQELMSPCTPSTASAATPRRTSPMLAPPVSTPEHRQCSWSPVNAPAGLRSTDCVLSNPPLELESPSIETLVPSGEDTPAAREDTPAAREATPAAREATPAAREATPAAREATLAAREATPAARAATPVATEDELDKLLPSDAAAIAQADMNVDEHTAENVMEQCVGMRKRMVESSAMDGTMRKRQRTDTATDSRSTSGTVYVPTALHHHDVLTTQMQ